MKPLRYLLRESGWSPAVLAGELQRRAGVTTGKLTGADLRQIVDGNRRSPAWLHRVVLELAIAKHWRLQSLEDCQIAVRTFRATHPQSRRAAFETAMSPALDNAALPPDLAQAWVQDVMAHPYAPLNAEQFDVAAAVLLRDGRLTAPTAAYARAVLVDGERPARVAQRCDVSRQTVSRASHRVLKTFHGD